MDLPEDIVRARQLLFTEGHLNDNFLIVENFAKEYSDKNFVELALCMFCDRAESIITQLEQQLENSTVDFGKLENLVNRIRKYTVSMGANNVLTKVNVLGQLVDEKSNSQSCKDALQEVKHECERFEDKMNEYLQMFWRDLYRIRGASWGQSSVSLSIILSMGEDSDEDLPNILFGEDSEED